MDGVFWVPTGFSKQAYSHLDMHGTVNVFPNKNHKTNLFFPFYERVGKDHPVTSFVFCRWTDILSIPICCPGVRKHALLLSFILESIFIPQSQVGYQKRGIRSFTFTRNLMFENGFSIRISRGLNTMEKNQRILQLEEILSTWEQGECTAHTEHSHWMKRSFPFLLQTDPVHQALNSRTQSWRNYQLPES